MSTANLLPRLLRLEELLTAASLDSQALAELAPPDELRLLFHLLLGQLVRRGPAPTADALTPAQLLAGAQQAADSGALAFAALSELRAVLEDLAVELLGMAAWHPEVPLWWSPLPTPRPVERQAGHLQAALAAAAWLALPDENTNNPDFNVLPGLLPQALVSALHQELETAYGEGQLALVREGVGASGQVALQRADWVTYTSGYEPQILRAAPLLAALVQWGREHLVSRLPARPLGTRLVAPQRAMLARYPAPSLGYAPHLDNPGGAADNGRTLTLVLYLNGPEAECRGGELALWAPGELTSVPPTAKVLPQGGTAVWFAARQIPHQVAPLLPGPPRWALTFWFNDTPASAPTSRRLPQLSWIDALLPLADPPLPPRQVLFHQLSDHNPRGDLVSWRAGAKRSSQKPRVGIVCTVYRGGADLEVWCEHHLALGATHLLLIFDHREEPAEAATATRLLTHFPASALTLWSGEEAKARWGSLPDDPTTAQLRSLAAAGASSHAVASRQTLFASLALRAAQRGELGGHLDWLLHLDADELFLPLGKSRGGATLSEHFSAATGNGWHLVRYLNHELLLPRPQADAPPRFKLNPRLAVSRLGPLGWTQLERHLVMAPSDPRPYFNGYLNGKSAVAVTAGSAAAGVHSWSLTTPPATATAAGSTRESSVFVAGPVVLHFHFASSHSFVAKYLGIARSEVASGLFTPSPTEIAALDLIRRLTVAGADDDVLSAELTALHAQRTQFSPAQIELLEEAGLIWTPRLNRWLQG